MYRTKDFKGKKSVFFISVVVWLGHKDLDFIGLCQNLSKLNLWIYIYSIFIVNTDP